MELLLSIESSCDDSSIALTNINNLKVIKHLKISQENEHRNYGGVVPELASRLHAKALPTLLEKIKPYFKDIKAVAVTTNPGLSVSLHEGVIMAKTVSSFLNIPIIGVNHLKGHIFSAFIEKKATLPILAILVSGGHTQIIKVKNYNEMEIVATTIDDSIGEAYDKVAKMLGLGYPGGPIIEELAKKGDENRFNFPIPLKNSKEIAFSFSGLKNAVRVQINKLSNITYKDKQDIAASFQKAACLHLLQKSKKIFKQEPIKDVVIVGGVAANRYILDKFKNLTKEFNKKLHLVELKYTSDNAAMIGRWAIEAYKNKKFDKIENIKVAPTTKNYIGKL